MHTNATSQVRRVCACACPGNLHSPRTEIEQEEPRSPTKGAETQESPWWALHEDMQADQQHCEREQRGGRYCEGHAERRASGAACDSLVEIACRKRRVLRADLAARTLVPLQTVALARRTCVRAAPARRGVVALLRAQWSTSANVARRDDVTQAREAPVAVGKPERADVRAGRALRVLKARAAVGWRAKEALDAVSALFARR